MSAALDSFGPRCNGGVYLLKFIIKIMIYIFLLQFHDKTNNIKISSG
jgi:hypothetical protein